jgi:hypothetical protein
MHRIRSRWSFWSSLSRRNPVVVAVSTAWSLLAAADLIKTEFLPAKWQAIQIVSVIPSWSCWTWAIGALSILFFAVLEGAYAEHIMKTEEFDAALKDSEQRLKGQEISATDLRAHIRDLQRNLEDRNKELEQIINSNRPELFAHGSEQLDFHETSYCNSTWDDQPHLITREAFQIANSGKTAAFEVSIDPILSDSFRIEIFRGHEDRCRKLISRRRPSIPFRWIQIHWAANLHIRKPIRYPQPHVGGD